MNDRSLAGHRNGSSNNTNNNDDNKHSYGTDRAMAVTVATTTSAMAIFNVAKL